MILAFKPQFVEPILSGVKIHAIREEKADRWNEGREIQFATGVRTSKYNQFFSSRCISVQRIIIDPSMKLILIEDAKTGKYNFLPEARHAELALHDGFKTLDEFWGFFTKRIHGKIIHWTCAKYVVSPDDFVRFTFKNLDIELRSGSGLKGVL